MLLINLYDMLANEADCKEAGPLAGWEAEVDSEAAEPPQRETQPAENRLPTAERQSVGKGPLSSSARKSKWPFQSPAFLCLVIYQCL